MQNNGNTNNTFNTIIVVE